MTTHNTRVGWVLAAVLMAGCGRGEFPIAPTPLAHTPVTTLQGSNYQGYIVSPSGPVTSFNMTLIARGLGLTPSAQAQTPGTTVVSGYFSTGAGVSGTLTGELQGTLENGSLALGLETSRQGCDERRTYTGTVTGSGVALVPGAYTQSCPSNVLDFAVQSSRPGGPACPITVTPATASFTSDGGKGAVTITTQAQCPWTAVALAPFLSIDGPATGSGSSTVVFQVLPNVGVARQGVLGIADQTVTVSQGAARSLLLTRVVPDPVVGAMPDFRRQCLTSGELNEWTFTAELRLDPVLAPVRITEWRLQVTLGGQTLAPIVLRELRGLFPQAGGPGDGSITIDDGATYTSLSLCLRGDRGGELLNSFVVVDALGTRIVTGTPVQLMEGDHNSDF